MNEKLSALNDSLYEKENTKEDPEVYKKDVDQGIGAPPPGIHYLRHFSAVQRAVERRVLAWYSIGMEKILGFPVEDLLSEGMLKEREAAIARDGNADKWDEEHYEGLAAAAALRKN